MPHAIIGTPAGWLAIIGDGERLTHIHWVTEEARARPVMPDDPLLAEACRQLTAYFNGALTRFDLPLQPAATPRGNVLRAAIMAIPFGETASYGQVARSVDSGPRAVGQACARNPFPVVVPCHRVLGNGGALGHYSGGQGVVTKRALLSLESRAPAANRS